ncbi:MAG: cyclase family protein [Candidatus Sumerlaeia bacterium]|nr:cyclase family protein [Candidatus Sumerlaeia bacterium]
MKRLHEAIDISVVTSPELPVYPGDPPIRHQESATSGQGHHIVVGNWHMTSHTGTHIDTPRHFYPKGRCITDYPPSFFEFTVAVVDAVDLRMSERHIDVPFLEEASNHFLGVDAVLFKTHRGELWEQEKYDPKFTALTSRAAEWIVRVPGLRLVGIDYLSIDPHGADPYSAHLTLLATGILILECVNLSNIPAGRYDLVCVPVCWGASEAAPCRALLFDK